MHPNDLHPKLLRQKMSLVVLTLTGVIPGLIVSGFVPEISLPFMTALIIGACGGATAGAFYHKNMIYWREGLAAGFCINMGWVAGFYFYAGQRMSITNIEIILLGIVGAIPGLILYRVLMKNKP